MNGATVRVNGACALDTEGVTMLCHRKFHMLISMFSGVAKSSHAAQFTCVFCLLLEVPCLPYWLRRNVMYPQVVHVANACVDAVAHPGHYYTASPQTYLI